MRLNGLAIAFAAGAALVIPPTFGAEPASAARPVEGARYADAGYYAFVADLRVSGSGRWLDPRRSSVKNFSDWRCPGLDFHLGSPRRPVRISRSGRFDYVRRHGSFVLRVSGRFMTKDTARIGFRYRRVPRRKSHSCDDSGRFSLSPRRVAVPSFRDCLGHSARTILSAPTGRVFWEPRWDDRDWWTTVAYACLFSANKRFRLGQDEDDDSDLGPFRLAGPYVAYHGAYCSMGCGFNLIVLDLRDGRRVREVPDASSAFIGRVTDLELNENGSIAWIATAPPYSSERAPSVSAYDSLGQRRLDTGNIALQSLTLDGSTLSWEKDGVARSATLD